MKFDDFFQRVPKTTEISNQKELATLLGVEPPAITLAKTRGVPKNWPLAIASIDTRLSRCKATRLIR